MERGLILSLDTKTTLPDHGFRGPGQINSHLAIRQSLGFKRHLNVVVEPNHDRDKAAGDLFRLTEIVSETFDERVPGNEVQQRPIQSFPHLLGGCPPCEQSGSKAKQDGDCECDNIQNESTKPRFDSEDWGESFGKRL